MNVMLLQLPDASPHSVGTWARQEAQSQPSISYWNHSKYNFITAGKRALKENILFQSNGFFFLHERTKTLWSE